jgi:YD repeat-containing protein
MTFAQAKAQIGQELVTATYVEYNARNLATKALEEGRRLSAAPASLVNITTTRDYNAFGEVKIETDALTNATEYKYNTMGRLIEIKQPQVAVWAENGSSQNLRPTEYLFYDKSGRLVAQRTPTATPPSKPTSPAPAMAAARGW